MALSLRTSSTTSGGSPTSTSLGGYASNTAVSTANGLFYDDVSTANNDAGHTDYRCVFIYNSGTTVMNNVKVVVVNKTGGSSVSIAASSVATNTLASYQTSVIASETTAPSITGSYAAFVNLGTLNAGQVKAVWLKRVTTAKTAALLNDSASLVISADEVIP